ncbi:endoplasmic reticulum resident protein 44-like [Chrysoperla carnea]|uniref:endoplasmic reticulum resident protein 44-like n=1 Tax=Chrysoperla carnea TaxID=189513 RepID=UPI001D0674D4|nr:endoplasmic reticulum resident protein 44-like [Chrysoperla carnea]
MVLLVFYTDWCRFSQSVLVVFEQLASIISKQYPDPGIVVLGKINCNDEKRLVNTKENFIIGYYPTIKVASYGKVLKRDYRGRRTMENFVKLIEKCLEDPNFDLRDTHSWQ